MSAVAIDDRARELLDALDAPRCEWQIRAGVPTCGAEAVWLMSASCGDAAYFCEAHKQRMHAQVFTQPVFCSRHPELGRVLFDWRRVAT